MNGPFAWIAAFGTMFAATLIAADRGRKVSGWGVVLFCAVSVTWIVFGLSSDAMPVIAMNAILFTINAWGVWQYLLSPKNRRVMDRIAEIQPAITREVEQELGRER